jgi:hypothetical protein
MGLQKREIDGMGGKDEGRERSVVAGTTHVKSIAPQDVASTENPPASP